MAQSSFPFENVDTTETQFSQMFRTLNAGVNGTPAGTELKVTAGTGLQVSVALGQAMVRGHYYISTAAELLTIGTANATNPRIDTVVLRLDPVANSIVLAVVAGTAAASPVAPTLTQTDAGTYEFPLANVAVAAGAGTVGTITDRRVFMGSRLQKAAGSSARDLLFPSPKQGDIVWRDDIGALETYFDLYNASTNPGGRDTSGWYTTNRAGGLVPVKPTSIVVASGSATPNSMGTVSFSGATAISLNGVFSSAFRNYRLVVALTNVASTTSLQFRYRTAGTDKSSATYYMIGTYTRQGTNPAPYNNTGDRGYFSELLAQSNGIATADISNPATANRTDCLFVGNGNIVTFAHFTGSILEDSAQVFDGITIYTTAAMTGTVTVYGYNA